MGTAGGKIGCAAAAAIGLPLLVLLFMVRFWGDCLDEAACHGGEGLAMLAIVGATGGTAAAIGFGVRYVVNLLLRWRRHD